MEDDLFGFVEECLAAGKWQHRIKVLRQDTSRAEREQNGGEVQYYLWPWKTKTASFKHQLLSMCLLDVFTSIILLLCRQSRQ